MLFTTIAPAGTVGYLAMLLAAARAGAASARRIERYLVIPLVLAITGLIASATHLGTPANALYVVTGIGRSPLSNEVAAAVAFLALGGAYWFLSFNDAVASALRRAVACLAAVAGIAFVTAIALAYSVPTVPTWDLPTVPAMLWLAALASGPFVGMLGVAASAAPVGRWFCRACLAVAAVATAADVAVLCVEASLLPGVATTVQAADELVPWMPAAIVVFAVCQAVAIAVAAFALGRKPLGRMRVKGRGASEGAACEGVDVRQAALLAASAALSLAGCFAVRFTFYAMHMTSGM